jgi:hypothetical protein
LLIAKIDVKSMATAIESGALLNIDIKHRLCKTAIKGMKREIISLWVALQ